MFHKKQVLIIAGLAAVIVFLSRCATTPQPPFGTMPLPLPSSVVSSPVPYPTPVQSSDNCAMVSETLPRVNGAIKLPAKGKLVLESHLATNLDKFSTGSFPSESYQEMKQHLDRSCEYLKSMPLNKNLSLSMKLDCSDVYNNRYVKQWTPPEGGRAGQGSTGVKPPVDCEAWTMNMYWTGASRPKAGTRFIIRYGDKAVVACAGYETGPGDAKYVGGAQGEVFWALEINNTTIIEIGRAVDQSLHLGPLNCRK